MNLKKFSEFSENTKMTKTILEEKEEIDLEEKTGDEPDDVDNEEVVVSKNPKSEKQRKEEEEEKLEESFKIEILEDNIIKFDNGNIKMIYELLSNKYSNMDYFIRKKGDVLHIVKYNEKLNMNINSFVDTLFKFYSKTPELSKICENIKIKGNDKFSVIENLKDWDIKKVVDDLTGLLSKKK